MDVVGDQIVDLGWLQTKKATISYLMMAQKGCLYSFVGYATKGIKSLGFLEDSCLFDIAGLGHQAADSIRLTSHAPK